GQTSGAVDLLADAEALWRGELLADFPDAEFATAERARLGELRFSALERALELELALGRYSQVAARAAELVELQPLHERPWAALMTALAGSGRTPEALRCFQRYRRLLGEELGLEPSSHLRALEERILRGGTEPSAQVRPQPAHNLPAPLTTFIGRATLQAAIEAAIEKGRLVTLTGPGGSGKTRLALEVGARVAQNFPGGVWLVELAPLTGPSQVVRAVADVLGVPGQPERDLVDVTIDAVRSRPATLLILDNCEHVATACAQLVTRLLARAAHLHVLATSRQPLSVPGEAMWPVPPLDVDSDAVALFRDRARLARADVGELDHSEAVAEICRRLDGLPLAIELAAAQVQAFHPADIAARLEDRFRLLQRPSPDLGRHHSLRATIAWSHDLLSPGAQVVLRRLAAFSGPFDLAAAEAVCAGPGLPAAGVPVAGVAALVGELVTNSLVARDTTGRSDRYRLLETVRVYALEQLDAAGEAQPVGTAHAAWCLRLAEMASAHIPGPDEVVWRQRLDHEVYDVRSALAFAAANQPENGLRLAIALSRYWLMWDRADEGLQYLPALLAAGPDVPVGLRARGLVAAAELGADHGEARLSSQWAEEALGLFAAAGDGYGQALAQCALASAQQNRGHLERAARLLETSTERFQADGAISDIARAAYALAFVETQLGSYGRAESAARRALSAWETVGSPCGRAKALWILASIARYRGDLAAATNLSEESLRGFADISDALSVVHVRLTLADVARLKGDNATATELYEHALPELERIGDRRCSASTLKNLATLALQAGQGRSALDLYCRTVSIRRDLGDEGGLAECLEGLAATCNALGQRAEAVTLLAVAHSVRDAYGVAASLPERTEAARQLDDLRSATDAQVFATAWEAGIKLTLEEAVERCLGLGRATLLWHGA
ncbi:MAG TPA: BTAD domain-containing putative transcriptional regulator, partial [Acidimicrobiales bacterium]|nr:BTAD domain-containing putative transcriptional regulator [Acidimicrobiales bacterium]